MKPAPVGGLSRKQVVVNQESMVNQARIDSSPVAALERLQKAVNQHDLDALAACFAPDFLSEQPMHPDRSFRGRDQVVKNWMQIFRGVPDIEVEVSRSAVDGDTVWSEWEWRGTRVDGTSHLMRGVIIQGVREGQTAWMRLYMEPVTIGDGIDASVSQHVRGE